MTDTPTITLRDHSQPCEHEGSWATDLIDYWTCAKCPGGRERTFREELAVIEAGANVVNVLVEVSDETRP